MREKFFICIFLGIIFAFQFYQIHDLKLMIQNQNIGRTFQNSEKNLDELKFLSCAVPVEGEGIIIRLDDSSKVTKSGENPNLYVVHDDDILRVINELKAAGAEAISINGQRLTAVSEIRCAGPTISVNNVRSSAPYEICAIGEKKSLENSIKMRGGVEETLKVWGIQLEVEVKDKIFIPAYKGEIQNRYAKIVE
ncbi:MAG: DUF881 domain-containing protein [Selenomonadaceae bacterium]|nr:DUF881 domain-containing protein [Selenomonadaceae bacterium]